MPLEPARALARLAHDAPPDPDALQQAARAFVQACDDADPDDVRQALAVVAEALTVPDIVVGGYLAMICGAVIERGADPAPVAPVLTDCLRQLTDGAGAFYTATRAGLSDEEAVDAERYEQAAVEAVDTRGAAAWIGLHQYWRGGIALLSRHPESRRALARLGPTLAEMAPVHEGAHWLAAMVAVADDEPFCVLEPSTGRGILASVSGVADNFQLHMLLMDVFPREDDAPPRISDEAVSVARGDGPQRVEEALGGQWNLWAWTAVTADGGLPDPGGSTDHWVWNEGRIVDIPMFEGRRVVLLGPPAYARAWTVQRAFQALPARVDVERVLGADEVAEHLERMRVAPSPRPGP